MPLDPAAVTHILIEAAQEEILPRFRALEEHEILTKDSGELVTVADEAAERHITRRLLALLPGSLVVGEEAVAKDGRIMDALQGEDPVWLVDPIDGTGNFAGGTAVFAVMVALVLRGETVAAWIHDPIGQSTALAERGGGALLDGEALKAAPGGPLDTLEGTLHAGTFATPDMKRQIDSRRARLRVGKSLRCAGHEYIRLAEGRCHFSLFTKLMPWDHAPGALIHREAGGVGKTLDGRDYNPARRDGRGLLLAPDEASWKALHDTLFSGSSLALDS